MPSNSAPASVGRPASAEADLFAATGRLLAGGVKFTELNAQRIATEAGVARSSFYVHFRDKVDLLIRLATQLTVPNFDTASAWRPADGVDGLTETFVNIVATFREHAAVRRALSEAAAYDDTVREYWARELDQFSEFTDRLLRIEQDAGRTPADLDVPSATEIIVLGGERAIVEHVNTRPAATDAAFAAELARIWWHGVYRRAPEH
ncbi:TetR/AcrR family transcriptional regulator [Kribbella lupini]|uniref:TetR/AcrR family transcriptional regulator n=1 Tax=Kribbella lupini TaxID=291602 RepID=A0ABN2AHI0_9ACTN